VRTLRTARRTGSFQGPELELHPLIYTDETHVVSVNVEGKAYDCVMKQVEFHPVTDRPIHADFQVLTAGEAITLTVPVQYHGTPVGQTEGGDTQVILHEMQVRCLPKDIPSHIDVEISHLNIGDSIHVVTRSGQFEFLAPERQTMVTVVAPKIVAADVDEDAESLLADSEEGEADEPTDENEA
jgi:large subunit ribosomal protein L25